MESPKLSRYKTKLAELEDHINETDSYEVEGKVNDLEQEGNESETNGQKKCCHTM